MVPDIDGGLGDGGSDGSECLFWEFVTFQRECRESGYVCRLGKGLGDGLGRHYEKVPMGFDLAEEVPLSVAEHAYIVQESDCHAIFGKLAHRE